MFWGYLGVDFGPCLKGLPRQIETGDQHLSASERYLVLCRRLSLLDSKIAFSLLFLAILGRMWTLFEGPATSNRDWGPAHERLRALPGPVPQAIAYFSFERERT